MRGFLSENLKDLDFENNKKIMDGLTEGKSVKSKAYNTYLATKDLLRDLTLSLPSAVINDINII